MAAGVVAFALVVVQHPDDQRFCLVHEKGNRGWWLPGGGVDAGQTFAEAAVREAQEEAGVDCILTGVLRVECSSPVSGRLRVIFHARPKDASLPLKSKPDHHSKGARWVTIDELESIAQHRSPGPEVPTATCYLRGPEPHHWFCHLARGGVVFPLSVLKMTRFGKVPEWDGPGDPPRAFYPTAFTVQLLCTHNGQVALRGSGRLPEVALSDHRALHAVAAKFAKELDTGSLRGIVQVRHCLYVTSRSEAKHVGTFNVLYAVDSKSDSAPHGCSWVPLGGSVVVAHDNPAVRKALQGLAADLGWAVQIFDERDVDAAVGALFSSPGALLICTATFPLAAVPPLSQALVWSQAAAEDANRREGLLTEGAVYVGPDEGGTESDVALLQGAATEAAVSWKQVSSQPLSVLAEEGMPPASWFQV